MTTQDNKALVRRVFEEIWNRGNLKALDELFAPEHVGYDNKTGPVHGLEGAKQFFSTWLAAFPDAQFHIEDQLAGGDKVANWASFLHQVKRASTLFLVGGK